MQHRGTAGVRLICPKQSVVVFEVFVAHDHGNGPGAIELASVDQTFIAEKIVPIRYAGFTF